MAAKRPTKRLRAGASWRWRWRWRELDDARTPFVKWDTQVFQQIAELPLGPVLVVSSKLLIVPLVYRTAHNDSLRIISFQAELSF